MKSLLDWYKEFLIIRENLEKTDTVDLSKFSFIDTELLLLVFPYLRDNIPLTIQDSNSPVKSYMDFITAHYNSLEENENFMPIVTLNENNYDELLDRTFTILNSKFDIKNKNVIGYIIGELYTNIKDHSKSTENYIVVQYYKRLGLEISVYDNGIGIPGNFKDHSLPFKNDCEAIEKAILGESTKNCGNIDQAERGRGLLSINNIMKKRNEDEFIIISNKGIYHYLNGSKKVYELPENYQLNGTLVSIIFKNKKVLNEINLYDTIE